MFFKRKRSVLDTPLEESLFAILQLQPYLLAELVLVNRDILRRYEESLLKDSKPDNPIAADAERPRELNALLELEFSRTAPACQSFNSN